MKKTSIIYTKTSSGEILIFAAFWFLCKKNKPCGYKFTKEAQKN